MNRLTCLLILSSWYSAVLTARTMRLAGVIHKAKKGRACTRPFAFSSLRRLFVLRPIQQKRPTLVNRRHVVDRRILAAGREQVGEFR